MLLNKSTHRICIDVYHRAFSVTSIRKLSEKKMNALLRHAESQHSPENLLEDIKKHRMFAQYNYQEWRYPKKQLPITVSTTMQIMDDIKNHTSGKMSQLKNPRQALVDQTRNINGHRKIKKLVPNFHRKRFPEEANHIYREAYSLLNSENWGLSQKQDTEDRLHDLVTEYAYPDMVKGLQGKTFQLSVFNSIEPPKVVSTLVAQLLNKENLYGQVTVRFHTSQKLVMYDRFGRLLFGSPDVIQPVLEYVVFERHLSDINGRWRIHGKLAIPENAKHSLRRAKKKWEKIKITHRGTAYWSRYRKWYVLNVKRKPKLRMYGSSSKRVRIKRLQVNRMRNEGKLPKPHKN